MNQSDKYNFINQLLDRPNLNAHQEKRIIQLALKEMEKDSFIDKDLEKRVVELEKKLSKKSSNNDGESNDKTIVYHKPKKVTHFLKLFKENTDLKWTTHTWDNKKYNTIEDFISGLNNSREYSSLFKHNRDLYNLIRYFIYEPQIKLDSNGVPEFGWPNLNEMKFGWQYPKNLLINWCKENYDNKSDDERKKPFQYLLPPELRPKKNIKGKEIKYFEDVVNLFKTEIQFREEYLYKELHKHNRSMKDFNFIGIESARTVNFYTYTPVVLSAIGNILEQIKTNETARDIKFSFEEHEDKLIISICQINSYPVSKELNPDNPKTFVGGHLNAIAESLFSLADFSVESRFRHKGENHCGELLLTYNKTEGHVNGKNIKLLTDPIFVPSNKTNDEVLGFTYKMTFYI